MKGPFIRWMSLVITWMLIVLWQDPVPAQPVSLPEETARVQAKLKPDEVMLAFSLTDSLVLVSAIAVDSTLFATQSLNSLFWESLGSFRKKLKSADPNEFSILGQVLYLYLVKPVEDFLSGRQRLIIIPGERLEGLPFEALVVTDHASPPYNICDIHYLVRDYEIVYHCSPVYWSDMEADGDDPRACSPDDHQFAFMGFSPVFSDYPGLSSLPASKTEINEIGSLFKQKGMSRWLVSGPYSDKEYFKSVAERGKIVHLATHYIRDSEDPNRKGFLFWGYDASRGEELPGKGVLTDEEIARLKLRADLVVLNACSSGTGQVRSGDTVQTVPCVFFTAGARNVMSTLWNVNDRLAGEFMVCFYRNWLSGKSYSQALRDVKLGMIRNPGTAMPTIWAPYVLTGH